VKGAPEVGPTISRDGTALHSTDREAFDQPTTGRERHVGLASGMHTSDRVGPAAQDRA